MIGCVRRWLERRRWYCWAREHGPLRVLVSQDELVIRIGIRRLAEAAQHCPRLPVERQGRPIQDALVLAWAVRRELLRHGGGIRKCFDEAIEQAYENGSTAFLPEEDR